MRLLWACAVLLAACGAGQKRGEDLLTDVRTFQEGLRWRRYDDAAERIPPASRARFLDAHDELDTDLRIDDYEVLRVTTEGEQKARIRVRYTWHLDSVGSVHDTTIDESWERQGKTWRIVGWEQRTGVPMPASTLPDIP